MVSLFFIHMQILNQIIHLINKFIIYIPLKENLINGTIASYIQNKFFIFEFVFKIEGNY